MLTQAERNAKVEAMRKLPGAVEAAVRGLTDQQLDTPYRDGGWTVRQVVHHLADSHMNAFIRMKLILTEDQPALKTYDQERWAEQPDVVRTPIGSSLMMLRGLHERWCLLLDRIPDTAWSRVALHPERGRVTLESLLVTYSSHGEKHVGHIMGLRNARKW